MATWQMRALSKRYNVIAAGPPLSLRREAFTSLSLFPPRSEGGPASFLAQLKGWSYTVAMTPPRLC
jgi:hypothetical protein